MVKRIVILGSTGSIGRQTLEVIEDLGNQYRVAALTAGSNDHLLSNQVKRFRPELAVLSDTEAAARLADRVSGLGCAVIGGEEGQIQAATWPEADIVVMAQVGFSGFIPLLSALKKGKKIALANKESLVIGGDILKRLGLLNSDYIIPVDSEHSAIRQCLGSAHPDEVAQIILTASGGPFFGWKKDDLDHVTPEQALDHPNWQMGKKITIDSATMMNKGLEVIEARWLFDISLEQIEVVIDRQSIVHSMVEYVDGSIIAQIGTPDMRIPIQYALTYPERKQSRVERFRPFGKTLHFEQPDRNSFPCLDLAYRAAMTGGTMPAALNGANEVAVEQFIGGSIKFTDIAKVIEQVMNNHTVIENPGIDDVIDADIWSRHKSVEVIDELSGRMM